MGGRENINNKFSTSPELLFSQKRKQFLLAKCGAVRRALQERCSLPLVMPQVREEAATGAALHARFTLWP